MARKPSSSSSTVADLRAAMQGPPPIKGRSSIDREPAIVEAIKEMVALRRAGKTDWTLDSVAEYLSKTGIDRGDGTKAFLAVRVSTLAYYMRTRFDGFRWSTTT